MSEQISVDDPRWAAAKKAIAAMYEYWKLCPNFGAVQWIQDTDGKLIVFTRGEYTEAIRAAIGERIQPEMFFELEEEPESEGGEA